MIMQGPRDAVGFFHDNAQMFDGLYQGQPEFHERVRLWNQLIDRYALPGGTFLDLGCGSGIFTFYLAQKGNRVIGVDGAADMIALCETRRKERGLENVRFVQGRLPAVDEKDLGKADLLISSSVVEYVDDLDATLALFARLLNPSGVLLVSMPNRTSLSRIQQRLKYRLTGAPEVYKFIRHFSSPGSLQRRVAGHGLTLLESHHYTHYTRIAKLAHALRLPGRLSEDLFVAAFRKR
jgi:2-polyprenyl-6-hydroxyphenyl methylase/3-demethylubiquinone-9 3-methyltransferase